eukprot:CAMPEP_0202696160 /NCGR_PEP_ID=MMETSP1385-20130828/9489_1 /ASSEMBLY_ACC=CAM_ASM_000861 /TAXON_ID=933848 /ORGANISM="Elphidium margaritaceum" /LENGTH=732 /DNA_ID=CAMNT_0049352273 /DNA_START=46 /DNA_END=2241 /DNA_ORIENTATION=+
MSVVKQEDSNSTTWDISLFTEPQIAATFACINCHNVPRQVLNDVDNRIFCEECCSSLKLTETRSVSAIDKMVLKLQIRCPNNKGAASVNRQNGGKNDVDENEENADDDEKQSQSQEEEEEACKWIGSIEAWQAHNNDNECPFATVAAQHENDCDAQNLVDCELQCGAKLLPKDLDSHVTDDCPQAMQTCKQCNRSDIARKNLDDHVLNDCSERGVVCKYAPYGCEMPIKKGELEQHYEDNAMFHMECKLNAMQTEFKQEITTLEQTVVSQKKTIDHLKYKSVKLQMQVHQKQPIKGDFLIIFESEHQKHSFVCSLNFGYNASHQNSRILKAQSSRRDHIVYRRIKDCSYCVASNVHIDEIIGITSKAKQQHIQQCTPVMSSKCICSFNVVYRIGGDCVNDTANHNICHVLGTDVEFLLPRMVVPRFNHRVVYSALHGILVVGGEPLKKEHAKSVLQEIVKEKSARRSRSSRSEDGKQTKAILRTVEQLKLAPNMALSHYYQVRNANVKKEEEKLEMPPEPELKWRSLASSMEYRRDCPSVALFKSGQKFEERLFVAGGWNESDLSSVEMYNFEKRAWRTVSPLNVKRNSAGLCEWKQKNHNMIIVGGWNKRTTHSVEEYDAYKNQWYSLKPTNHAHRYYPACAVLHDLNPFINTGYGVIVVVGSDGRLYGDEYMQKQQNLIKQNSKKNNLVPPSRPDVTPNVSKNSNANAANAACHIKEDWGFIEFYDPRDW